MGILGKNPLRSRLFGLAGVSSQMPSGQICDIAGKPGTGSPEKSQKHCSATQRNATQRNATQCKQAGNEASKQKRSTAKQAGKVLTGQYPAQTQDAFSRYAPCLPRVGIGFGPGRALSSDPESQQTGLLDSVQRTLIF